MSPLFAKDDADAAVLLVIMIFSCGFLLLPLLIGIFFLLALQKALSRCQPRNRTMEPGEVWLNLIPLFGLVWQFITISRVGESLEREFRSRGWHRRGEDYGKGLGIATCALNLGGFVPYIGFILSFAGLICFILYWVKIANYSQQIAKPYRRDDYDDYDDDYDHDSDDDYDDRPRGRGRDRDW